jgi:hypothetical protein
MRQVEPAKRAYDIGELCRGRRREQRDSRRFAGNGLQNGIRVHGAGGDVKFGPAAQCAAEQLHLHAVGVGDEQADALRTVDEGRTHNRGLVGAGVQAAILGRMGEVHKGTVRKNSHTNFKMGIGMMSGRWMGVLVRFGLWKLRFVGCWGFRFASRSSFSARLFPGSGGFSRFWCGHM